MTYTLDTLLAAKAWMIDAGNTGVLAVTGDRRSPQMPSVPTFAEAGLPGFDMVAWFGLGGPKDMPPALVATINGAIQTAMASPEVRQKIESFAATPMAQNADQFAAFIKSEFGLFEAIVKSNNLRPDS